MRPPTDPEYRFDQPWHAQLFATTLAITRTGAINWADWSDFFDAALIKAHAGGLPREGSAYYEIWLAALEDFLVERNFADRRTLSDLAVVWKNAYLSTPHGQPVEWPRSKAAGKPVRIPDPG